jgi:hypothetical protein
MDIVEATRAYERWMRAELARRGLVPVPADLAEKHRRMAEDGAFAFLRATYYRWAQLWPERCAGLARAPRVLAIGDLHLENFGTWRDGEGRLCWGINDFDEAATLPYTSDLVRLAASALLVAEHGAVRAKPRAIVAAILEGYAAGVADGAAPLVLEEENAALRAMAYHKEKEPKRWWAKLAKELFAARPADGVRALLVAEWPREDVSELGFFFRSAGLGSLGRPRYVVRALWRGGLIAREAKALLPSAARWVAGGEAGESLFGEVKQRAAPCLDPLIRVEQGWVLRRLAPRSSKIEVEHLPKKADPLELLGAMGRATANIHHASPRAIPAVARDLGRRKRLWLFEAAKVMAEAMRDERKAWTKAMAGKE